MRRLFFALLMLLPLAAGAEDSNDVRGTKSGCKDFTATGSFVSFTSADLEDAAGSSTLASGLYWTEVTVTGTSATVYVCTAAAASCGADTTNKRAVASGAALTLPMRGLATATVALRAANGTTGHLCGYFRSTP